MGVVTTPSLLSHSSSNSHQHPISIIKGLNSLNSMSQSFHPGIYNFSNGFDASLAMHQDQHPQHQSQRHKLLSLRGFEPQAVAPPSLVGIEEEAEETGEIPVYETGGMLSEMFNFQSAASAPPAELLENQIPESYHRLQRSSAGAGNDWYGGRHGSNNNNNSNSSHHVAHQNHQISSMNADSAAVMQLFLMKPQPRSHSPPPPPAAASSSTQLHFLLPNQSTAASPPDLQGFHTGFNSTPIHPPQFTWVPDSSSTGGESTAAQINSRSTKIDGAGESQGQGLSLSLSPLQHLEAAKAEELRMGDGTVLYFNQGAGGGASSASSFQLKNLENHHQQQQQPFHLQGVNQNHHVHVGFSPSLGMVNVLRNSKYLKAAQELLEEFCSVGRGQLRSNRLGRPNNNASPNSNLTAAASAGSSSCSKDLPPLSAADRIQYQRRKAALLSILDEVDRRYNHYCGQMQMVVNSFDSIMGYGAARPYTALAQKAMSRHFRCLKDAIGAQLKQTRELLGEKEGVGASGITKGETPRLKLVDQSLRQQRAFHQMGMMEQEAWRPQRGLPERSVNILRAWLFEHFLHPYPSDADKHLLARQTGLSRNQVSNWFINARVRLWKPMVEDMYQQESKEEEDDDDGDQDEKYSEKNKQGQSSSSAQTTTTQPTTITTTTTAAAGKRSEIDALENDPSVLNAINNNTIQRFSENQASAISQSSTAASTINIPIPPQPSLNHHHHHDMSPSSAGSASSLHRFPAIHHHHHLHHHQQQQQQQLVTLIEEEARRHGGGGGSIVMEDLAHYGASTTGAAAVATANPNIDSTLLMFGSSGATTTGDVSLTLGLRHAGNLPENNRFPLSDFGSC